MVTYIMESSGRLVEKYIPKMGYRIKVKDTGKSVAVTVKVVQPFSFMRVIKKVLL